MATEKPSNGLHTKYYDKGQKKSVHHYKDGSPNGEWKQWYENGQISIVSSYKQGQLDGKWKQWYENGQVAVEGSLKNNKPVGTWLHHVHEDKNLKLEEKDGSLRYWKFVVNAAIRYGEILDKKNSGLVELQFVGKHIENQRDSSNTRKKFEGSVTINKTNFKNTIYILQSKQLITYYPKSNNPEAYKNKLGGLVDYLMYSGSTIDKKRLASFYHECYKKNPIITAGELIERDLTDITTQMMREQKETLSAKIRNEILTEIRNEILSGFEQTNTPDTREVVEDIKNKIENVKIEKKLQDEEKHEVEKSGRESVNIVVSDILISVDSIQYNGYEEGLGNLCTRLIFENSTHKYMKLSTWDQSGEVTKKAKTLIGKNVTTTCWDPRGTTKWSDMGYFNNIFEM